MPPLRVVFDTNAVVPALLFPTSALSWLRLAWQGADLTPLATEDTLGELRRVLGYRKFNNYADLETRAAVLRQYERWCLRIVVPDPPPPVPECRDPNDRKFLELARFAQADALVTGDRDLLALATVFPVPIITPAELYRQLPAAG